MQKIHDFLLENVHLPVDAWSGSPHAESFPKSSYQLSWLEKINFANDENFRFGAVFFAPVNPYVVWLGAGLVLPACEGHPPASEVEADLMKALPFRLRAACGLLGGLSISVNSVSDVTFSGSGSGFATVNVNNKTLFNEQRTCDMKLQFFYERKGDQWLLGKVDVVKY